MPISKNSSGVYHPKYKESTLLACLAQRPSARLYCGGQSLQATLSGPCRACLVSHPWQLAAYANLGLGRDGANNLASSRLESWAFHDTRVEKTLKNVLDSTKCPHKNGYIEESLKHRKISLRGVLVIVSHERPRGQCTAKLSASLC